MRRVESEFAAVGLRQRIVLMAVVLCIVQPLRGPQKVPSPLQLAAPAETLRVDFSVSIASRMPPNGFILSASSLTVGDNTALTRLVAAVDARFWRVPNAAEAQVAAQHGDAELVVMDAYRARKDRRKRWPYEDFAEFEEWLRAMAREAHDQNITWEIWNEWDAGLPWWAGTEAQANETYLRADRVIREELGPLASVAGPTLAVFDSSRIRRFADFCLAHACQINALSWHELEPRQSARIEEHVRWARKEILDNAHYAPLKVRVIQLNEVGSKTERYSTGDLVSLLSRVVRSGVDAVARSCWIVYSTRASECHDASLDGSVALTPARPRPVWWIYAAYASTRLDPVAVFATHGIEAYAGRSSRLSPAALVAISGVSTLAVGGKVHVQLVGLEASGGAGRAPGHCCDIVARRVPWSGLDSPLDTLPELFRRAAPATGTTEFDLDLPARTRIPSRPDDPVEGRDAILLSVEPQRAANTLWWPFAPSVGEYGHERLAYRQAIKSRER